MGQSPFSYASRICDSKLWRNKVVEQIRRAKQNYYQSLFNECQGNSSKIWKLFNDITGRKENNIISLICESVLMVKRYRANWILSINSINIL